MALVNCKQCGKEVNTASVTCPYCGYPIKPEEEQPQTRPEQEHPPIKPEQETPVRQKDEGPSPKATKANLGIPLLIIGIIIILIIIYFFMSK